MSATRDETHYSEDIIASRTHNGQIYCRLDAILTNDDEGPVDWDDIRSLLQCLVVSDTSSEEIYSSPQDDPTGRLLMTNILSRYPPLAIVDTTISIFPHSLHQNPAAFLAASKLSSTDILELMFRKISLQDESCPYPWILSEQVTVDTCKTFLELYPEGVMKSSSFLSSFNLLDYFLIAPEVVDRRKFDIILWSKFKLVLVAAGCMINKGCTCCGGEIAPVHLILNRVLSRPDFWTRPAIVEHILWLLHQLRWTDPWIFEKESEHGRYPIHVVLSYRCTQDPQGLVTARALSQLLLEACPLSASCRFNGKLPLHMAVENGWPCHDLILAAHPESLDVRDTTTDQYPFQSAANFHQRIGSPISLDMTYELLRANPMQLCSMHDEAQQRFSEEAP